MLDMSAVSSWHHSRFRMCYCSGTTRLVVLVLYTSISLLTTAPVCGNQNSFESLIDHFFGVCFTEVPGSMIEWLSFWLVSQRQSRHVSTFVPQDHALSGEIEGILRTYATRLSLDCGSRLASAIPTKLVLECVISH
jgi:hypothetical protein